MSNFLRRFKVAMLVLKHYPVVTLPDGYWSSADAKAYSNFMTGDVGSKIRNMRFNRVYEAQQRAITNREDPAYAAGVAFGILAMTSEEDSLLQVTLPEQEFGEGNSGFRSVNR